MKALLIGFLTIASTLSVAQARIGDVTCKRRVNDVEVTIKYSAFITVAEIDLKLIEPNGRRIPFRGKEPRLVKMIDAKAVWNSPNEYYGSSDDYVDLIIQWNERNELVAIYSNRMVNKYTLMISCK